jgi:hypothetical protein
MLGKIRLWVLGIFTNKYSTSLIRHGGQYLGTVFATLLVAAGLNTDKASALAENATNSFEEIAIILVPFLIAQTLSWFNAKKNTSL